jgi:hypothetical protein
VETRALLDEQPKPEIAWAAGTLSHERGRLVGEGNGNQVPDYLGVKR